MRSPYVVAMETHSLATAFSNEANTAPFDAVPNTIALDEMNAPVVSLRGLLP